MYGSQVRVGSSTVGGGDQVWQSMLRVGRFIAETHGEWQASSRRVVGQGQSVPEASAAYKRSRGAAFKQIGWDWAGESFEWHAGVAVHGDRDRREVRGAAVLGSRAAEGQSAKVRAVVKYVLEIRWRHCAMLFEGLRRAALPRRVRLFRTQSSLRDFCRAAFLCTLACCRDY